MTTMLEPSVTQKFIKLGSVTPASSAYLLSEAMVSSIALRRISGENERDLGSGICKENSINDYDCLVDI